MKHCDRSWGVVGDLTCSTRSPSVAMASVKEPPLSILTRNAMKYRPVLDEDWPREAQRLAPPRRQKPVWSASQYGFPGLGRTRWPVIIRIVMGAVIGVLIEIAIGLASATPITIQRPRYCQPATNPGRGSAAGKLRKKRVRGVASSAPRRRKRRKMDCQRFPAGTLNNPAVRPEPVEG